ncbi:MAG: phosphotransferase family protein [Candidatus Hermodarchaeota archaeon]
MASFEENRACDISIMDVIDSLYGFFPDIEEDDIQFFYHGTYNVFEVKNRYIFRIPTKVFRNQKGAKLIQNEIKMLHHIRKYVSVAIPDVLYVSFDPDCPLMGYEKIDGIPLSRCYYKIPQPTRFQIAKEIGVFLSELHSNELLNETIRKQMLDSSDFCERYRINWVNYFDQIQSSLFNSMNQTQKNGSRIYLIHS